MTTRADYTDDEWAGLVRAPILAGAYVALADPSPLGFIGEIQGLVRGMTEQPAPLAAADLVGGVVADFQAKGGGTEGLLGSEPHGRAPRGGGTLEQLSLDLGVLDTKSTPDEARAFKEWLVSMAFAVANASKEGGLLGMGGVEVSDKEEAALDALRRHLLG